VIAITKLKTNYRQYEEKRKLMNSYDLFMADDRIIPMLPRVLGKEFFKSKRLPIPIKLANEDRIAAEVAKARDATYFYPPNGSCCCVRIAHTGMTVEQIEENINCAIDAVIQKIPKKWKNIQSINIKTNFSVALPVFNSLPAAALEVPEEQSKNLEG